MERWYLSVEAFNRCSNDYRLLFFDLFRLLFVRNAFRNDAVSSATPATLDAGRAIVAAWCAWFRCLLLECDESLTSVNERSELTEDFAYKSNWLLEKLRMSGWTWHWHSMNWWPGDARMAWWWIIARSVLHKLIIFTYGRQGQAMSVVLRFRFRLIALTQVVRQIVLNVIGELVLIFWIKPQNLYQPGYDDSFQVTIG